MNAKPKRRYRRRERPSAIVEVEVAAVTRDGFVLEHGAKGKRQRILLPLPEEEPLREKKASAR